MNRQPVPATLLKQDFPGGRAQILLDSGDRGVISSFCLFYLTLNSRFQEGEYREENYAKEGWAGQAQSSYGLMKFFFFPLMVPARGRVIRFVGDRLKGSPKTSFLLSLPLIGVIEQEYR